MLKLIALNYTVMLNGYSQWLNIKGKNLKFSIFILIFSVIYSCYIKMYFSAAITSVFSFIFQKCLVLHNYELLFELLKY